MDGASTARIEQGLRLYRAGRHAEARAVFDALVARFPREGAPLAWRGLARCQLGEVEQGIADLRAAAALAPHDARVQASLGMALLLEDRLAEARVALERALALAPGDADSAANLSLAARGLGDFAAAEAAARLALTLRPDLPQARINLAYALLARGAFREGWEAYCQRPHAAVNLRDPALAVTAAHHDRLPAAPAAIIVHGEQGLGDTLFFLRFAPRLKALGHRLAFWGDPRLQGMLARGGLFEHFLRPEAVPGPGIAVLWAGDLPRLLGAHDPAVFPPALALAADPARRAALQERFAAFGPAPYLGVTWRAGGERRGRLALAKEIDPAALGAALARVPATVVSVQRAPRPGEREALAAALGAPVHDASSVNQDLEDALAAMALLDEYVGVSNTNTHLRAGLGRPARVLVPWPPEWRWLESAERSPWFPGMPLYRQARDGAWGAALERLAGAFTGS